MATNLLWLDIWKKEAIPERRSRDEAGMEAKRLYFRHRRFTDPATVTACALAPWTFLWKDQAPKGSESWLQQSLFAERRRSQSPYHPAATKAGWGRPCYP